MPTILAVEPRRVKPQTGSTELIRLAGMCYSWAEGRGWGQMAAKEGWRAQTMISGGTERHPEGRPAAARVLRCWRAHRRAITWCLIVMAMFAAVVLGIIGFQKNLAAVEPEREYSFTTLVFMVLQLFVLNSGTAPEPVPWELEIARALAVLAAAGTVLKAVIVVFRQQWEAFYLRFVRNHVVVCGLDQKGRRLVHDLLDAGQRVVGIERNGELPDAESLREAGAVVLAGEATDPDVLARAAVGRAGDVLIVCGQDAVNLEVAAVVGAVCARQRPAAQPRLRCHVHLTDPRLPQWLDARGEGGAFDRLEYRRFDVLLNSARLLLDQHPLDRVPIAPESPLSVQLILLGYSREAECLLIQTAQVGHYANLHKPRCVLVDPDAARHEQRLRFRYPQIDEVCQLEFHERDVECQGTMQEVERWASDPGLLPTLVVSCPDENQAFSTILGLPPVIAERDIPVLVRLNRREGLLNVFGGGARKPAVRPFGSPTLAGSAELVLQRHLDRLAREIHQDYVRRREAQGDSPQQYPAMRPWDELPEPYKEANRQQADHIPVKLRAIGCVAVLRSESNGRPAAEFTPEEVERLAKMEHQRWCANRWLDGWRLGKRDDRQKRHPNLVPWEALDEPTRDYDRDAVRQIPDLLKLVDHVLVRSS